MTELEAADRLSRLSDPRGLFAVVEDWLATHGYRAPRRSGDLDSSAREAAVRFGEALRTAFLELVTPSLPPLRDREAFLVVYLWRQIFLNPYSALNLFGPPADPRAQGGASLLARSLAQPFDAPDLESAEALWSGPASLAEKTAVACWLVSLPEVGLTASARDRCLRNALRLARGALRQPPPGVAFTSFVEEVMTGLFRASYAGGNTREALSALGDLVATWAPVLLGAPRVAPAPPPRARPRVGYVSSFFRAHPVAYYMANRILCHDRDRFEVVTFAIGRRDDLTEKIASASARAHAFPDGNDVASIARAIRAEELDLLVHADIGMDAMTLLLAGLRLAPRQIALMGHATSTGLPHLTHYLGGDHEGADAGEHYRERLVRLPNLGAAQLSPPSGTSRNWRAELGIPSDAVVFVSLATTLKLLPERDEVLVEILARLPRAWLLLKPFFEPASVDERLSARLRAAAARRGVEGRLVIVPPLPRASDLPGLLQAADVQLDTFPFGGWTSNLDALHAGLPIVTQEGALGRSRWGAAFLRALGMSDGIASDEAGFVEEAVRLGSDGELRARLRATVRERAGVFFDGPAAQPAYEASLTEILSSPA